MLKTCQLVLCQIVPNHNTWINILISLTQMPCYFKLIQELKRPHFETNKYDCIEKRNNQLGKRVREYTIFLWRLFTQPSQIWTIFYKLQLFWKSKKKFYEDMICSCFLPCILLIILKLIIKDIGNINYYHIWDLWLLIVTGQTHSCEDHNVREKLCDR